MSDSIVLINDLLDVKEIIHEIKKEHNATIFSFDINSHYDLLEQNLEHELVEDYVSAEDKKLVTETALRIALDWHKIPKLNKILTFDDINLGWLLEHEFHQFLVKILKDIIGIKNILEKFTPDRIFVAESYSKIIKSILKDENIEVIPFSEKANLSLVYDKVNIPIKIGPKQLNFSISRNFALKIKKIVETFSNNLFSIKYSTKINSDNKKIMLVDFDPSLYENFLENLSSFQNEILLLNNRKPAVWNINTLNIIRNTNSKIISLNEYESFNVPSNDKSIILQNILNKLKLCDEEFEQIFSISNLSFWGVIQKSFFSICSQRFSESIIQIQKISNFFLKNKISSLISMYNVGAQERVILFIAKKFDINCYVLQHGFYPQNNYIRSFLPITGYEHILSVNEILWGNITKKFYLDLGVDEKEIVLVGSPRHDAFFNTEKKNTSSTILLATNVIMGTDYSGFDTHVHLNHHNFIREVCKFCLKLEGKKIQVKLHPGQSVNELQKMIQEIDPKIPIYTNESIRKLIESCEILISTSWSTVIFEAMILGKPTITFLADPKGFENEEIITNGITCYVKNIEEFQDAAIKLINDKKFRDDLVLKGKNYVKKFLNNTGSASKNLAQILSKN